VSAEPGHHTQDLAIFKVKECHLAGKSPPSVATYMPRNLQMVQLRYKYRTWQEEAFQVRGYGEQGFPCLHRCCMHRVVPPLCSAAAR
jgi:hypothetical protein